QPTGGAVGELCSTSDTHDGSIGNPAGSLRSRLTAQTGLLLFDSHFAWRSPSFTVFGDPEAPVTGAVLPYDRSFDAGPLINLKAKTVVDAVLVDETAGRESVVNHETLTSDDDAFAQETATAEPGALARGHSYHIEFRIETTTGSTASSTSGSA